MQFTVIETNGEKAIAVQDEGIVVSAVQDAMDLIGEAWNLDAKRIVLRKEQLCDDFFELRTKLAGEILQKYVNYNMKITILGDFSQVESKSLRDFIFECNKGEQINFRESLE